MEPSLIIIGAGVAGLSAGCYARMNGYSTTLLEMGDTPGGLCTSWRRKGYLFDGSVAGLAGSAPGSPLFQLWEEIGVIRYCPLHYGENFGSIRLLDGRTITVYTDIDRLEAHLLAEFPAEAAVVREFSGALRSVLAVDIPFSDASGLAALRQGVRTFLDILPRIPALVEYGSLSIRKFAAKTSDPGLAAVLTNLAHFGGQDVPLLTVLLPLAYAHRKTAGIPLHGWLDFARAIERRFLDLGGSVRYAARVQRLEVEGGRVRGVLLSDGTRLPAERVLSAADGRFTRGLLLGRQEGESLEPYDPEDISDQPVQVNLGSAMDFSADCGPMTYLLPEPFEAGGVSHQKITVHNKYYDPNAAPPGKSAVTVFLDSSHAWWQPLASDPARYQAEKERCAEGVIATIERFRPGFRQSVEVVDVATPLTRERYTGNWLGAMQARKPNSSMLGSLLQAGPRYHSPDVEGFYMAGQWVEAWGGITTAAQSGRKAVQALCRRDGKVFTTSRP